MAKFSTRHLVVNYYMVFQISIVYLDKISYPIMSTMAMVFNNEISNKAENQGQDVQGSKRARVQHTQYACLFYGFGYEHLSGVLRMIPGSPPVSYIVSFIAQNSSHRVTWAY